MLKLSGKNKGFSQLLSTLDSETFFGGLNEKTLLKYILSDPQPVAQFPYVNARDAILAARSEQNIQRVHRARLKKSLKPEIKLQPPSDMALDLMKRQAVTSKDIDAFLQSTALDGAPYSELQQEIENALADLISASTPNNLRAMMHYLSKYWQVGILGMRPTIFQARLQARRLLVKAIESHPPTKHQGGGEQVGIPDFPRFQQFVDNFFAYLNVNRKQDDELDHLLLQLCAKSGPLAEATELVMTKSHVDEATLQVFLPALSASHPSLDTLAAFKPLLLNDHTGPTAVTFLLNHVESADDIMYILENVDQSTLRYEVYEQCQTNVVQKIIEKAASPLNLALVFGVLERIGSVVDLSQDCLDHALNTALEAQNPSAVRQLLLKAKHTTAVVEKANKYVHI